jgi:hypothetical protein
MAAGGSQFGIGNPVNRLAVTTDPDGTVRAYSSLPVQRRLLRNTKMKSIRETIVTSLVIVALYAPLVWCMIEIRSQNPGTADFFELHIIEQMAITVLMIAPLWSLSFLKICWKTEHPMV